MNNINTLKLNNIPEIFTSIIKSSPTSIIITNHKGEIEYVNPKFTRLTGYTLNEVIGKTPRILKSGYTKPAEYKALWKTISSGKEWKGEFHNKKKNGELYWELASISSMKDSQGKITHYIAIKEDITDRKLLEQQKDDFLNIASHELKTPVTSIKAYGQILQKLLISDKKNKALKLLTRLDFQINRLTALVNDLLDVTRIQAGKLQFREEYFDFHALVNDVVEDMQRTTNQHKITAQLLGEKIIYGDKNRVGQIIINFLSNAIKYSPSADKIIIRSISDKKYLTFSVEDFGIGISEESQKKIFDRYYRADSRDDNTVNGLGLGLYISYKIAKKQNGDIWVKSEKGKGSTFFCRLPILPRASSSAAAPAAAAS